MRKILFFASLILGVVESILLVILLFGLVGFFIDRGVPSDAGYVDNGLGIAFLYFGPILFLIFIFPCVYLTRRIAAYAWRRIGSRETV